LTNNRRDLLILLVGSPLLFVGLFVFLGARRDAIGEARRPVLLATMHRAEPVIAAIGAYTKRHGKPPADLDRLVPGHLPCLPEPGPLAKGGWRYEVGKRPVAGGWSLYVMVSREYSDPTGFGDVFAYHPSGRYEGSAYGGGLERVGAWGYYHE
jgi:hypothetical protein